ncbi:hypothetical protein V6Z12_A08G169300 [Gossypium hirsutum]
MGYPCFQNLYKPLLAVILCFVSTMYPKKQTKKSINAQYIPNIYCVRRVKSGQYLKTYDTTHGIQPLT